MNRIASMRKSKGITQKELGRILGVAQNTISNWEKGNREPDYESLKKMAFYFDCSTDYLLGTTPIGRTFVFDQKEQEALDWAGDQISGAQKEKKAHPR